MIAGAVIDPVTNVTHYLMDPGKGNGTVDTCLYLEKLKQAGYRMLSIDREAYQQYRMCLDLPEEEGRRLEQLLFYLFSGGGASLVLFGFLYGVLFWLRHRRLLPSLPSFPSLRGNNSNNSDSTDHLLPRPIIHIPRRNEVVPSQSNEQHDHRENIA